MPDRQSGKVLVGPAATQIANEGAMPPSEQVRNNVGAESGEAIYVNTNVVTAITRKARVVQWLAVSIHLSTIFI